MTLALLAFASVASAGDAAKLNHIGFSADGKSYAFMESGVHDGMGNAYARVRFIDLAGNKMAASTVERIQTEEEMDDQSINLGTIRAQALKKSRSTLKKLNINSSNGGEVVVSRKLTDLASKSNEVNFSIWPIIGGLTSPAYKLKLTLSQATPAKGVPCLGEPTIARKIKLELTDNQSKKTKVLQADTALPASRGCTHNYEIEDVVVFQPEQMSELAAKVVVLLRVYTYGFEGEDVRYMAVSGALNNP